MWLWLFSSSGGVARHRSRPARYEWRRALCRSYLSRNCHFVFVHASRSRQTARNSTLAAFVNPLYSENLGLPTTTDAPGDYSDIHLVNGSVSRTNPVYSDEDAALGYLAVGSSDTDGGYQDMPRATDLYAPSDALYGLPAAPTVFLPRDGVTCYGTEAVAPYGENTAPVGAPYLDVKSFDDGAPSESTVDGGYLMLRGATVAEPAEPTYFLADGGANEPTYFIPTNVEAAPAEPSYFVPTDTSPYSSSLYATPGVVTDDTYGLATDEHYDTIHMHGCVFLVLLSLVFVRFCLLPLMPRSNSGVLFDTPQYDVPTEASDATV